MQVGEELKTIQQISPMTPADTDYIELSLEGLEEAKTTINGIGNIVSSSCIPSECVAGGDGLRKATAGKKSSISLTTRENEGSITPGPSLAEIACHIEAVGGIKLGNLPRLIQVSRD